MDINLDYYKIFYYVAKCGSISGAAKELFITQPAVSQAIKLLEGKLGGQLFFRTPKGIVLTKEGEVFYKYIEQAFNFIITAENKFFEAKNLMSGEIRIGASDTLCKYYLIPYLKQFNSKYPKVKMQVTNRTTLETIELLRYGKIDIGIINLPIDDDKNITILKSLPIQDCFVVGEKYKALSKDKMTLQEIKDYPILLLERGSSIRNFIDNYAKECGVELIPEIELGSIDLLVEFAKIGLGVSCVVKNYVQDELKRNQLYELKLKEKIPQRNIGVIALKNFPLSTAAREFLELLQD